MSSAAGLDLSGSVWTGLPSWALSLRAGGPRKAVYPLQSDRLGGAGFSGGPLLIWRCCGDTIREKLSCLVSASPNPFVLPESQAPARLVPRPGTASSLTSILIDPLPFTLGRSADRSLTLSNPHISRAHALIDRDADGYFVRDTGSRHGTFVNGVPITSIRLRNQDILTLGTADHAYTFEQEEQESSTRVLIAQFSGSRDKAAGQQSDLSTLALFLKAAQSLNQHGALQDVLRTMLEYTIRLTGAERGFVFLGDDAESLRLECAQDRSGRDILGGREVLRDGEGTDAGLAQDLEGLAISHSTVREAARSQLEFIVSNVTEESNPSGSVFASSRAFAVSASVAGAKGCGTTPPPAGVEESTRTIPATSFGYWPAKSCALAPPREWPTST